jgi:hypothetical protein
VRLETLATLSDALLLLALVMTREPDIRSGRSPKNDPESGRPAGFPEIALVELPESLQEPVRALGEIVAAGARFVGSRRRLGQPDQGLRRKLAALCGDLETLATLTHRAAKAGKGEEPRLRAFAFELADRLSTAVTELRKVLEVDP